MNTIFTVTIGAGTSDAMSYTVDLGQDILDGVSESDRDKYASQSMSITVQGKLRKVKTGELGMEEVLHKTYPNAEVSEGVVKTTSSNKILKDAIAVHGKDKVEEVLRKMGIDV